MSPRPLGVNFSFSELREHKASASNSCLVSFYCLGVFLPTGSGILGGKSPVPGPPRYSLPCMGPGLQRVLRKQLMNQQGDDGWERG